jgi:phospholipase/carboxylesterase/glyoxalase family protein
MMPHEGQPVATAGPPLGEGQGAIILIHGRNAGPANILDLAAGLDRPDFSCLAPAAADRTWYPNSFMADIPANEPGLSSGLGVIAGLVAQAAAAGVPPGRVVLMGFSQGACLTAEFAVRHPARYGAVVVFSGGLIGPNGTTWPERGSLAGTPVFLGCSDIDSHVPAPRVRESEAVFARLGAEVTARIYPGMGHLVNDDEMQFARQLLDRVGT